MAGRKRQPASHRPFGMDGGTVNRFTAESVSGSMLVIDPAQRALLRPVFSKETIEFLKAADRSVAPRDPYRVR